MNPADAVRLYKQQEYDRLLFRVRCSHAQRRPMVATLVKHRIERVHTWGRPGTNLVLSY